MAFTAVEEDVCELPGVGGYSLIASGALLRGQAVTLTGDNTVGVPTSDNARLFGIVDAAVAAGDPVCIYGPGNIVYCKLSGAQAAGTRVGIISEGYIANSADYSSQAIVVEGTTSTDDGKILILG
jgi:hypothetical protein